MSNIVRPVEKIKNKIDGKCIFLLNIATKKTNSAIITRQIMPKTLLPRLLSLIAFKTPRIMDIVLAKNKSISNRFGLLIAGIVMVFFVAAIDVNNRPINTLNIIEAALVFNGFSNGNTFVHRAANMITKILSGTESKNVLRLYRLDPRSIRMSIPGNSIMNAKNQKENTILIPSVP